MFQNAPRGIKIASGRSHFYLLGCFTWLFFFPPKLGLFVPFRILKAVISLRSKARWEATSHRALCCWV